MLKRSGVVISFALVLSSTAQSIHISGVVKNSSTSALLRGVEVRLLQKGLIDTTDSAGLFALDWEPTVSMTQLIPPPFAPPKLSSHGSVTFSIPKKQCVIVCTYSVLGKAIFSMQKELSAGVQTITPPVLPSGVYIHQIRIGDETYALKYAYTGNRSGPFRPASEPQIIAGAVPLVKQTATTVFMDTLQLFKAGYSEVRVEAGNATLDTTIFLEALVKAPAKGVYEGTFGSADSVWYGKWHIVIDSAGTITGDAYNGVYIANGTVDKDGNITMGLVYRDNSNVATYIGSIANDGTIAGTFTETDGSSGIFIGRLISADLITITGTVTMPAAQPGKPYIVNIDSDLDGGNGTLATTWAVLGSETSFNYSISYIPGFYYQICLVDLDGDGQPSPGDYMGGYGLTLFNFPNQHNLVLSESGQRVFNFTTAMWQTSGLLVNGDFNEGNSYWNVQAENGGVVSQSDVADGAMHIAIDTIGPNDWDIRLNYWGCLTITQNKTYELSFDAWSDGNRKIRPDVNGWVETTFTHFLSFSPVDVTTEKKRFTMIGTMTSPTNAKALLDFYLSDNVQDVFVDNITLTELH